MRISVAMHPSTLTATKPCLTRKHGVGAAVQGAVIANLRKYNSIPPVWFVDVNGEPLEMDTDALLNQAIFQRSCMEQLNFMPAYVPNNMGEPYRGSNAGERKRKVIIDVSQDASVSGQFYDHLEEFCQSMQQAEDKEEIL